MEEKAVDNFVNHKLREYDSSRDCYAYALGSCRAMMKHMLLQMTPEQQKKVIASLEFQTNFGK